MKKRILMVVCVIAVIVMAGTVLINGIRNKSTDQPEINNVFDEMVEKGYDVVERAEHVMAGGYDAIKLTYSISEEPYIYIGLIYSREYRKLYIYGDTDISEDADSGTYQEIFEECLRAEGISWGEVEDCKEDFICRDILGTWFDSHNSSFSRDSLGDLEVIDYLMPYEYCGVDNEDQILKTEIFEEGYQELFEGKVEYTIWNAPFEIQCIQQSRDYGYRNIMDRINADINGFDTTAEKFSVKWRSTSLPNSPLTGFIDESYHRDEFAHWLKYSGKIRGNLTKLAYSREEGEDQTIKMLRRCSERTLWRIIEECEFYMDEENLYLHFPYYDYKAENPGWLENGQGQVWMGWLVIRLEDIQDFLQSEWKEKRILKTANR